MAKSYFERDSKLEKKLNLKILAELSNQGANFQYCPTDDSKYDLQKDKSGIDAIFASKNLFGTEGYKNVDFKSATSWVADADDSRGLKTFAFELSFINKSDEVRDGWLFGDKYKATDYYSLQWLWRKPGIRKKNWLQIDDIGHVESLVISKEKIQDYARSLNVTEDNYRNLSHWLASKVKNIERYYDNSATQLVIYPQKSELNLQPERQGNHARLLCSNHLQERPVNLIIPKEDLIGMAEEKAYFSYEI